MATETTFTPSFSGRIPGLGGGSKVPGPGLKFKYGKFTVGTAEYPAGGYTAADLATACGMTYIEAIVPCGLWMNASGVAGFPANWDGAARKLQAFGNIDADLAANNTVAVEPGVIELTANDASLDAAVLYALVIGY